MKKLITLNDVINVQFYRMPKSFFNDPKYQPMRCESKLAYMLLLDLVSLSMKNNWANEKNQVYVKLSRTNLQKALNIKSNQKAADIMKELVDFGLIVNKRMGLTKCNQIYIYPLDYEDSPQEMAAKDRPKPCKTKTTSPVSEPKESTQKAPLEAKPKKTQPQEAPQPAAAPPVTPPAIPNLVASEGAKDLIAPASLIDPAKEVEDLLKNQIHLDHLKQSHDPDFVDEIANNIIEMFLSPSTRIGKQDKPNTIVRGVIRKLKTVHIEHVINQFREVSLTTEVYNPRRYIQTLIYNSALEANTKIIGHIQHHFGYC